jgi:nucleolar pre-ribosomal-associated protein 2
MRGVLDPGFWAILDAMGMEVVRTVGAALDRAGRAVFKGVVEDWRRFGRWEGA